VTAPRSDRHFTGTEHDQLLAFVDDTRDEVVALLDGLTEGQARAQLVPSATTLLGLVKHAAFVERVWFGEAIEGRSRADLGIPASPDESFALAASDTITTVLALYAAARAAADTAATGMRLDDLALNNRRGPLTLRWVYVHLIAELARHAGHGDILREQILID
jgi:hypothetical protein